MFFLPSGDVDDLREEELPPYFAEVIPNVTVPRGRDARIPCVIDNLGSYRPAWIKVEDKGILSIHQQVISRNYRISLSTSDNRNFVLHIKNVQESDKGGYMCQINTSPMMSQVGYLDVLVPPDIVVEESSSDVVVREGSNVTLICKAKGYPRPTISWRREDNEPIPLGSWKNGKKTQTLGEDFETSTRIFFLSSSTFLTLMCWLCCSHITSHIHIHIHTYCPRAAHMCAPKSEITTEASADAQPPANGSLATFWTSENFMRSRTKCVAICHFSFSARRNEEKDIGRGSSSQQKMLRAGRASRPCLPRLGHCTGRNSGARTMRRLRPDSKGKNNLVYILQEKRRAGRIFYYHGKYFASEDSYSDEDDSHDETSRFGSNNGPSTFSVALAALLVAQLPVALPCL
ncbi:unnamed protein product [Ixodes hexagonus]